MDDIALVDTANSGSPLDRRNDRCVAQLHPRILDGRFVRLNGGAGGSYGRNLGIELLAAGEALWRSFLVALKVAARIVEIGLIPGEVGQGAVERGLERPRVDLRHPLPDTDILPFAKIDALQLAVDPRLNRHGVVGLHGAHAGHIDRHLAFRRDARHNRHRLQFFDGPRAAGFAALLDHCPSNQGGRNNHGRGDKIFALYVHERPIGCTEIAMRLA
jgi:hypothetical protein